VTKADAERLKAAKVPCLLCSAFTVASCCHLPPQPTAVRRPVSAPSVWKQPLSV
jgi:hypothetical protein